MRESAISSFAEAHARRQNEQKKQTEQLSIANEFLPDFSLSDQRGHPFADLLKDG